MAIQYDDHPAQLKKLAEDSSHFDRFQAISGENVLNFWRLETFVSPLFAFMKRKASASWLTIGDGMYGQDANRILRQGVAQVHASDMSADLLAIASARGYVREFSAQNAESLGFADASFDYVFCKDSYHHFPRPGIAIHEMLRVARQAVILMEPCDPALSPNLRSWLGRLMGKPFHDFETVGNYVYSISRREMEKILLGVGLRHCAFRMNDDTYSVGVDELPIHGGTAAERLGRLKFLFKHHMRGLLWRLRLIPPNSMIAVLFKTAPSADDQAILRRAGFALKTLPQNPYASAPADRAPAGAPEKS